MLHLGTIQGAVGLHSNRDELNLAADPSQTTAAAPSPQESWLLCQTEVTASFMLESQRLEQLMAIYI